MDILVPQEISKAKEDMIQKLANRYKHVSYEEALCLVYQREWARVSELSFEQLKKEYSNLITKEY